MGRRFSVVHGWLGKSLTWASRLFFWHDCRGIVIVWQSMPEGSDLQVWAHSARRSFRGRVSCTLWLSGPVTQAEEYFQNLQFSRFEGPRGRVKRRADVTIRCKPTRPIQPVRFLLRWVHAIIPTGGCSAGIMRFIVGSLGSVGVFVLDDTLTERGVMRCRSIGMLPSK